MKFKLIATDKLIEHPENKRLFKDIRDTNPSFWIEFKESIKQFGILEPLIVNEDTMEVRSGNQRLKAAIELGIEELPIVLITDEDSEIEIKKMIASNVYRRTIDAFSMFEYIGKLRPNADTSANAEPSVNKLSKELHKHKSFISAADIFNKLPQEEQDSLKEWFKDKNEGQLVAEIRTKQKEINERDGLLEDLESTKTVLETKETELEKIIESKENEIEELKESTDAKKMEERENQIEELLNDKEDLENKIESIKLELKDSKTTEKRKRSEINDIVKLYSKELFLINTGLDDILESWEFVDESVKKHFLRNIKVLFESINEKFKGESTCKTLN